jgi:hypothetical protein
MTLAALALLVALPVLGQAKTLGVEVWTDRGDDAVYQTGDAMQVKARTSDDAYMLVYEIDSEGHVSVLYPWRRGANLIEGRRTYRLPPEGSNYELAVEKSTGQGFIVAIASRRPFRDLPWYLRTFDPQGESMGYEDRHDDEEGFDNDGKVVGDPMVAMERIRRRVLDRPGETDDFATSYTSYYVGHEVRYPRYVCADCHRNSQWAWWDGFDPYYTTCPVVDFRVNWNWCWGPCMWGGHVPYYFYVVRNDCPPRYRPWYEDRSHFSSWDGYQRWNQLWGSGVLTRYKSPPPTGYVAPPPGRPGYSPGGTMNPPGFMPGAGGGGPRRGAPGGGFRAPVPIGRSQPVGGTNRPVWSGRSPAQPAPVQPSRPEVRPTPPPRQETPRVEPQRPNPPRQETPRQEPRRESPRGDHSSSRPARQDHADHGNKERQR